MNEFVDILLAFATLWVAMAMPVKARYYVFGSLLLPFG
jgi:hypothetical protein